MPIKKILLLSVILLAVLLFFILDLGQYLQLSFIQSNLNEFNRIYQNHPLSTLGLFFGIYILVTALSLPGAAIMTLAAGALFGLLVGFVVVSFASTLGATLAFLASRWLFREQIEQRFGQQVKAINRGIQRDGAFYLFTLRLVPAFPFFLINLVMGLTQLRTWTFYWVSQLGMIAGTLVYVNAGTQLAQLETLRDILSPGLILSFVLLGLFPWLAKLLISQLKRRRLYKPFNKPKTFDRNVIVIGAGSAGLVTAYIAAAVKAKVSLIEKHKMGGDCLNTGCVPSKALIRSTRFLAEAKRAKDFGLDEARVNFRFDAVMDRVQQIIKKIEPHDSVARYQSLGVDCIQGEAMILSPYEVAVNGRILTTRNIVIATGASPAIPAIRNIEAMAPYTSDTIWQLRDKPKKLLVLGGGPIGCELAQCFSRLGSEVCIVLRGKQLMPKEDPEVAELIAAQFAQDGIQIKQQQKLIEFDVIEGQRTLITESAGVRQQIPFDCLLVATGRKANIDGFGLDKLNIPTTESGTIEVNGQLQTCYANIYACGDVAGPYQFTHTAAHQAWYAAVNALFGSLKRFTVDYSAIPHATFTEPEVARVGLNEQEAKAQQITYEVTRYDLNDLDRAITDDNGIGFVKVLTRPGSDQILGATIVGHHSGELIAEFVTAMRFKLGLNKILSTIHIYPTMNEANKYTAGRWKQNHTPAGVLHWVERFHRWQRRQ